MAKEPAEKELLSVPKFFRHALMLFLAAAMAASGVAYAAQDAEVAPFAKNLTPQCVCTCNTRGSSIAYTRDLSQNSHLRFPANSILTYTWTDDVPVKTLYLEWFTLPGEITLRQSGVNGVTLSEKTYVPWQLAEAIPLEAKTRSITLETAEQADISTCLLYGAGNLPKAPHAWKPSPEKLDYLVIAMHPDDDILFLGGIVPIFGAERGYTGTVLYMAGRNRERCDEAVNGLWAMGGRYYPFFNSFHDVSNLAAPVERRALFREEDVVESLTVSFRRLRPEVVISHDLDGEYGHFQHKLLARAVLRAAALAGDPTYDAASAAQYGVWSVKKVYLHLYPENTVTLDMYAPLAAFDGKNALEVDIAAFSCHYSQRRSRWAPDPASPYFAAKLGLARTAVGFDTGNDIFENIPEEALFKNGGERLPRVFPASAGQP